MLLTFVSVCLCGVCVVGMLLTPLSLNIITRSVS